MVWELRLSIDKSLVYIVGLVLKVKEEIVCFRLGSYYLYIGVLLLINEIDIDAL